MDYGTLVCAMFSFGRFSKLRRVETIDSCRPIM
jgi:hypothetical protein